MDLLLLAALIAVLAGMRSCAARHDRVGPVEPGGVVRPIEWPGVKRT
jgi:hypothetical protein